MPPSEPLSSYDQALATILNAVPGALPSELVPVDARARGRALADAIYAPENLPLFANSAVDGYALHAADAARQPPFVLTIGAEVRAGTVAGGPLVPGIATPLYTGAPVPDSTASIVMVEDTERQGKNVLLHLVGSAGFIRQARSDTAAGTLAVPAGAALDAGVIGLLSALNVAVVSCARRPRVGIITTGDEVIPVGEGPLLPGQIRDANGPALWASVEEAGGQVAVHVHAHDTPASVRSALDACADCDVILSCGGVSVGEHDYVKSVVGERGALDLWRVAIKPGKPLAFGTIGNALFWGLPGNPVSSLVTFELFVRPALRRLSGHKELLRRTVSAVLRGPLRHESGRREFVRARLHWENDTFHAAITGEQASHRLTSLMGSEALLIADECRGDYNAGERLPAFLLS